MNQNQSIIFNLSFLKKEGSETIAINYQNKSITYNNLWSIVSKRSLQLSAVNSKIVIVNFQNPIDQIINLLAVIEAGGEVFISPKNELIENSSVLENLNTDAILLFTDTSELQSLEEKIKTVQLQTEEIQENNNIKPKGGLILSGIKNEMYRLSLDQLKPHLDTVVEAFDFKKSTNIFSYKQQLNNDILELILPVLYSNTTLNIIDESLEELSNSTIIGILKITKEALYNDSFFTKEHVKNYFSSIVLSSSERITNYDINKLQNSLKNNTEITVTYQLPKIGLSVIQSKITTSSPKKSQSITYTKPFGKCNIQILDSRQRISPLEVSGTLWFESKILQNSIGENNALKELKIGGAKRKLRALENNAKFSAGGKILILNKAYKEILIDGKTITPDVTEEALNTHPQILKSEVFYHEKQHVLVGLIMMKESTYKATASSLRNWLKKHVNSENIPAHFEIVNKLPVNNPQEMTIHIPVENFSETERSLATIWEEVLETSSVYLDDNFFEIGGHSLMAIKLSAIIGVKLGKQISIKDIFTWPILTDMAKFVQSSTEKQEVNIIPQKTKDGEEAPLSFIQEGLWFIDKFQGSVQYNVPGVLTIKGDLDKEILETVLQELVYKHKVLRTVFTEKEGEVYQKVQELSWSLNFKEVANYQDAIEDIQTLIKIPFDLSKDYMIKATLLQYAQNEFVLGICIHHIVFDGWSAYLFLNEMRTLYEAKINGTISTLEQLPIDYIDYSIWERNYISGNYLSEEITYWKNQLEGIEYLDFPTDFPRPTQQRFVGNRKTFDITPLLREQLANTSQTNGVTLFMTMLASFKVLLYKYTGQEDVCVGSPIAGRNHKELESLIGFLANTLALRTNVSSSEQFITFLQQIKETTLDAYLHQDIPFEKIVDAIGVQRETSRTPIFQIMFSMEEVPELTNLKMGNLLLNTQSIEQNTTQFDINVYMEDNGDRGMEFHVEYDTDLFTPNTIDNFGQHYINLLEKIILNPAQSIAELSIINTKETKQLTYGFNNNKVDLPFELTTDQVIQKIAKEHPNKIALKDKNEERTYKVLDINASKQAHLLREKIQLKNEDVVAVIADRSVVMIEAIYGIWKAGGVYLPIHPELPEDRIKVILEDAKVSTIVYTEKYYNLMNTILSETTIVKNILCLDGNAKIDTSSYSSYSEEEIHAQEPVQNSYSKIDNLAYIIYTSGSTGKPKGALLEHKGLLNHLFIMIQDLNMNTESCLAQNASQSFDISVWQMFNALIIGGTTVVYNKLETLQVNSFINKLNSDTISLLQVVPSYLSVLLDEITETKEDVFLNLKYLLVTGETVKKNLLDRWFAKFPEIKVVNAYGPTEAADDVTLHIMSESPSTASVPIGKSLANLNIYIVNNDFQLCPVGVKGEILVSGVGVGRGYINDIEKTRKAFTTDPFIKEQNTRLYKTGDIGKYLPNGTIEFFGRKDYQVKVRGYRIELEEIELHITALENVKEAIALVLQKENQLEQLYGFVTAYDDDLNTETVRQELSESLPEYMLPTQILLLDKFPLTRNGKVDRKQLAQIDVDAHQKQEIVEEISITKTEQALIDIWKELLDKEEIETHNNFFDLGGHSLKVISMISHVKKKIGAEISIKDVFIRPNIKSLATLIDETSKVYFEPIPTAEEAPYYAVSNAQRRLWVLDRFVDDISGYNSYNAYKITGKTNIEAFGEAVTSIVNRHEVLRTTFSEKKGEPVQIIHNSVKESQVFEVIDYTTSNKIFADVVNELTVIANTPFNLEKQFLFTSKIYILDENTSLFFCSMHHIICDGWSNNILVKEILKNYSAFENNEITSLPKLNIQYKDYALWQLNQVVSGAYEKHREYWHKTLGGNIPVLNFPSYEIRPAVQEFSGTAIEYTFNKETLEKLKVITKKEKASLFMMLVSLVNVLLYKYTEQTDIVLGTGTAGRTHPDLENQLGYYINTIVLRNKIDPEKSFNQFLRQVKENTIEAFEHQDYPFDILVNELDIEREISRNPIFDVMILLQSFDENEDSLLINGFKDAQIEQVTIENKGTPFDMDFDFMEQKDELHLTLTYSNVIYNEAQMQSLLLHLELLIEKIIENPDKKAGDFSIITTKEENLISELNKTEKELPLDKTFHHYLEKFAVETPSKTAIIFEKKRVSYTTLNKQVNKLARAITNHQKIKEDDQIAILLDRSDLVMTTVLAVWKLAGTYIPIDKKVPDNRVISMLKIGNVKAIIADRSLVSEELEKEIGKTCKLIFIQDLLEEAVSKKDSNINIRLNPNSLSVTMFTSGSTGLPKGAMNEHIGMMNHALATIDYLEMDTNSVLIQNASLSFDIAVWQLFTALISGGTTAIYGDELVNAPEKLLKKLIVDKATILQIVPSYLSILLDIISEDITEYPLSITNLICCGEAANPRTIEKWLSHYPTTTIINDYGPAEASDGTTWNAFKNIEENSTSIPIGKPIYNMANYIVDDYMNLCPIGIIGEICVAGVGVGRGYINEPVKTQKAFLEDPFVKNKNQRLYKTGDLGKLLPNGMIEFHGRKDYQVKINGQRIELGEIEIQLLQLPSVKETTVLDRVNTTNGRKYLHAFIVFNGKNNNAQDVKNALSKVLPSYMVPAEYQETEKLPLTMSGKIDRKYLHKIANDNSKTKKVFITPENDVEHVLVAAWKSILKLNEIGTTDNFYEAGGDSISAIQVSSYLYKHQYQVEVRDIMRYATIKESASFVQPLQKIADQTMVTGKVGLTPIQTAFFKANKKVPEYYNQSIVVVSQERINIVSLEKTLKTLQNWHDALRSNYQTNDVEITQVIQDDNLPVSIKVYEASNANCLEDIKELAIDVQSNISLENGPLMHAGVFKTKEVDYVLLAIHHLVVDGVSWRILLEDFLSIYNQIETEDEIELPAKTDSFKKWSEELQNFMTSSNFEDEKLFWNTRIAEATKTKIPYDVYEDSKTQVRYIETTKIQLDKEYVSLLETKAHKAFNTEMNDILLAALSESVYKTFSLTETAIMLESHGRTKLNETLNTNRTVGWFTSEYPVYLSTTSNKELSNLIKETKEYLHKVPNNGIGFGLLRYQNESEENNKVREIELPQIAFNYLGNIDENPNEESNFRIVDEDLNIDESLLNQSDFPLEFISAIKNGKLEITLHYNVLQFEKNTIEIWLQNYQMTLKNIIDFCVSRKHSETTPSDYDYSDLSLDDLVELNDVF
jgi:amino acid adenylation domain-containing protein/non-ribosomal peptide synthase protein (TIGR01720 family)